VKQASSSRPGSGRSSRHRDAPDPLAAAPVSSGGAVRPATHSAAAKVAAPRFARAIQTSDPCLDFSLRQRRH
jgi:hypothetical protein